MLYIIDGTGAGFADDDPTYARDMKGGFCRQLESRFGGRYRRGPDLLAKQLNTWDIAEQVLAEIKNDPDRKTQALYLAGHSRGGAAAIRVAQLLKRKKKIVKALFLFDAVDRTVSKRADLAVDVQFIPRNVLSTYHVRRDPRMAHHYEVDLNIARLKCVACMTTNPRTWRSACAQQHASYRRLLLLDDAMKVRARSSYGLSIDESSHEPMLSKERVYLDFGNCGVDLEPAISIPNPLNKHVHTPVDAFVDWIKPPACKYLEKVIYGSHGAIGGSPIGFQDQHWQDLPPDARRKYDEIIAIDGRAMKTTLHWMEQQYTAENLMAHKMPSPFPFEPN